MKLIEVFNREIKLEYEINSVAMLNYSEFIILTNVGEVLIYNLETQEQKLLFETNPKRGIQYEDGGFDPTAIASIYTMDEIIVIVNDFKQHGFIYNSKENYVTHISRTDYYSDISKYPIALFKNTKGEPHLIFGVAWNRIQIVNLTTRQVVTADKSLIEENAEQNHIDFYKTHKEHNKLLWPHEYDYFYGQIIMSPNQKKFISVGWVWGSADCCKLYDVEDFMTNHRISDKTIGTWEHNNRGICFVDNEKIAVLCNPYHDDEDDAKKDDPYEIRLYNTNTCEEVEVIKLKNNLDLSEVQIFYNKEYQCFCVFSEKMGLAMISLSGEIILHITSIIPQQYDAKTHQFIQYHQKTISLYQVVSS